MEFINPDTMIPLNWCHYEKYVIQPLEGYLQLIAGVDFEQCKDALYQQFLADFPHTAQELFPQILKKEIIFPDPNAGYAVYDAWSPTKPDSFSSFASLWRYGSGPSNEHICGWAKEYGLPYETPFSKTLSSVWGYSALICNLPQDLSVEKCLQLARNPLFTNERLAQNMITRTNKGLFAQRGASQDLLNNADRFYRAQHSMFVSTFHTLSLEAHLANCLFSGLIANMPYKLFKQHQNIQKNLQSLLGRDEKPEKDLNSEWFDPRITDVSHIKVWRGLHELIRSKLNGLTMSLRAKQVDKSPHIELRYAYKAEDLLAVMWVRFYEQMVDRGPNDRCIVCGKIFQKTKGTKRYCSEACGNSFRANKSRKLKRESVHNAPPADRQ